MSKLYAVTGHSESGDDYFFGIFNEKPTQEQLYALVAANAPDEIVEDEENSGEFFCYVYCEVHEADGISELPEPDTRNIESCT